MFIPFHLSEFFSCVWDGGLVEFRIADRHIGYDDIFENGINSGAYPKAKEIWEKRK